MPRKAALVFYFGEIFRLAERLISLGFADGFGVSLIVV
jgi:hypothetical protein